MLGTILTWALKGMPDNCCSVAKSGLVSDDIFGSNEHSRIIDIERVFVTYRAMNVLLWNIIVEKISLHLNINLAPRLQKHFISHESSDITYIKERI